MPSAAILQWDLGPTPGSGALAFPETWCYGVSLNKCLSA